MSAWKLIGLHIIWCRRKTTRIGQTAISRLSMAILMGSDCLFRYTTYVPPRNLTLSQGCRSDTHIQGWSLQNVHRHICTETRKDTWTGNRLVSYDHHPNSNQDNWSRPLECLTNLDWTMRFQQSRTMFPNTDNRHTDLCVNRTRSFSNVRKPRTWADASDRSCSSRVRLSRRWFCSAYHIWLGGIINYSMGTWK